MKIENKELVREAIAHIRAGRNVDAITALERMIEPKWHSEDDCRLDYESRNMRAPA